MSFDLTPGLSSFTNATFTSDQTTRIVTNGYARLVVTTAATSCDVTAYCNNAIGAGLSEIACYVNGVYDSQQTFANSGATTRTFAISGGAVSKTVEFINGGTTQGSGATMATMSGCYITVLAFNAAFTQTFPTSANNICIYGDSIAMGQKSTISHRDGFAHLLRRAYSGQVWVEGGGSGNITYDTANQTRIDDWTARIVAALPNTSASTLWCQMGTNDVLDVAATFKTNYSTLVDAAHTALPNIKIVMACLLPRGDGAGVNEPLAVVLRAKQAEIVAARTSFMTFVDTTRFINYTTHLNADLLHLSQAGHAAHEPYIRNHLNGLRVFAATTS